MEMNFVPRHEQGNHEIERLKILADSPCPLEELMLTWLSGSRVLRIAAPKPDEDEQRLLFLEVQQCDDSPLAMAVVSIEDVIQTYGKPLALKEEEFSYADKEGYTPDTEWFEMRSKKLGINWSDAFDDYVLPPRALINVVLSYCLSSAGMVEIRKELTEDDKYRVCEVFKVTCMFFGKDNKSGWEERSIVIKKRLEQHLARRKK